MDKQRFVVSDRVWKRLEPLLPGKAQIVGRQPATIGCFWRQFSGA